MWASGVIKLEVTADLASGFADRLVGVQVDVLVFERTPEAQLEVERIAREVLVNPVIEEYTYRMEP